MTTADTGILIDPEVAIMQPSFTISELDTWMYLEKAQTLFIPFHYPDFTYNAAIYRSKMDLIAC
ncbi:MAG: hypothetical protein JXA38_08450 [Methanosarcinaceae archaeon]|nr:hypothetical protein [Methanosarcinaceae archaeon]